MDHEHEAYWATEGLFVIADAIKAKRGDSHPLVLSGDAEDFVCSTFAMRAYRESIAQMGEVVEDPPNFEFPGAGFELSWYKYAGRSPKANRPKPPGMMWELAVAECIKAVAAWVPPEGETR